jgi:DNA invertase Pin-like site-specific DNA recombinase
MGTLSSLAHSRENMPEANDLTVGIMALVAQAEREAISRRTKEALAVAKARGVKLENTNGAESMRRASEGGSELCAAVSANARPSPRTLRRCWRISGLPRSLRCGRLHRN